MIRDPDEFKLWIVQRLSEIECKCDPISIAIYVVAILGNTKNDFNIRKNCVSYLEKFIGNISDVELFVDDLLEVYKNVDLNSSTEDDLAPRMRSSIEAIEHSPRKSPIRSKHTKSFCPPRRDRSSSTESGSSVEERRTSHVSNSKSRSREEHSFRQSFSRGSMPIDSIDSSRQANYFYRREKPSSRTNNCQHVSPPLVDPSVVQAMKNVLADPMGQRVDHTSQNFKPMTRKMDYFGGRRSRASSNSLLISNMPPHLNTIGFLNEHYADFGTIGNIQVGYGGRADSALVSFATAEDAQNALQSSNSVFSDGSISVSLLNSPGVGAKRVKSVSFPPRSKLSLNNTARRKTDMVVANLERKNEGVDTLSKLDQLHGLKLKILKSVEEYLQALDQLEAGGKQISESDRTEVEEMKAQLVREKETLANQLELIERKRNRLRQPPAEAMSPIQLRALLLSVELSLLSQCPLRNSLLRKRQQIMGKLCLADNSFVGTVKRLMSRIFHTSTNERFELDKRCKTLSIKLSIGVDPNQLVGIFKERLFADSAQVMDSKTINATYSSHSKAEKVLDIIKSFTGQPLGVEWADQVVKSEDRQQELT